MDLALKIVAGTPTWVFLLFFGLLALGLQQTRHRQATLRRVLLLPAAMAGLAGLGVSTSFGAQAFALPLWVLCTAAVGLAVVALPVSPAVRYDAATRSFTLPGTGVPLALMMGVFFTKYGVGIALAMSHGALAANTGFVLACCTVYGLFSGAFLGRAARLLLAARGGNAVHPA